MIGTQLENENLKVGWDDGREWVLRVRASIINEGASFKEGASIIVLKTPSLPFRAGGGTRTPMPCGAGS